MGTTQERIYLGGELVQLEAEEYYKMYIAYVDESGDPGRNTRVTKYFTLSGIIVADSNWKVFLIG